MKVSSHPRSVSHTQYNFRHRYWTQTCSHLCESVTGISQNMGSTESAAINSRPERWLRLEWCCNWETWADDRSRLSITGIDRCSSTGNSGITIWGVLETLTGAASLTSCINTSYTPKTAVFVCAEVLPCPAKCPVFQTCWGLVWTWSHGWSVWPQRPAAGLCSVWITGWTQAWDTLLTRDQQCVRIHLICSSAVTWPLRV